MKPNSTKSSVERDQKKNVASERQSANWDLQNAIRNYSTLVITQVAIAFFSFASVWLMTRYLGTEGYGSVVAVIAAAQVAQIFVNWTCVALARYGIEEFVESASINKTFWARTLIFVPNMIIVLAFSFLWLPLLSGWLKLPPGDAWFVVAYFVALALWLHVQHALQGAKLPQVQGVLLTVERILVFSALLILLWFGALTYLSAMTAYIVSPLLMVVVGLFQLRRFISRRIEFDFSWLKEMMKFSLPLIPFYFVGYFSSNYLDAIFITQYLSKSDLGIYSVAYQINGIFLQFPVLANTLLLPLFVTLKTTGEIAKIKMYIQDVVPVLTLIGGLGIICAVFLTSLFLPFAFGQTASEIMPVLLVLSLSVVLAVPVLTGYIPYFNAFSASYIGTINAIATSLVNLTANFILIPPYGLKGSAWATVLSYGTGSLITLIIVSWKFKVKHKWTIPALIPAIAGTVYAAWSENLFYANLLVLILTVGIFLWYRESFTQSIALLKNYRKLLLK